MASFEDFKESVMIFLKKLSHESRRTAFLARLRLDLKGLDFKKREAYTRLGEKVYDLHKRKAIKEEVLNETLFEQFEELEDIEKKAVEVLEDIQKISLMEYELRASASSQEPQASATDQHVPTISSELQVSAQENSDDPIST